MVLVVLVVLVASLVVAVLSVKVTDAVLTRAERSREQTPGRIVCVGGVRMHVHVQGSGAHTLVLVPGLGTPCPVHDFAPSTDALASSAAVAVVEPFGYGWSEATDREVSPVNVAADLRAALQAADVPGPYVLAGHSIGGL